MKKSIRFLLLGTAASVIGHLIVEALRAHSDLLYRHAAGESDYERTHPRKTR